MAEKLYLAWAEHVDSRTLIGVFMGNPHDIKYYCDEKHTSYGTTVELANPVAITPEYTKELKDLKAEKQLLEFRLKQLDMKLNQYK